MLDLCESCPMLGFCTTIKKFQVYSNGGVFSVSGFCYSALQSFKCVCVERGHTCAYTKLTFCLTTLGTAVLSSLHSGVFVHS